MSDWNNKIIDEFRAKHGVGITNFGDRLLLLNVRGAKSGKTYTIPLAFHRDGDNYVVAASKGGAPTNPDWYHNVEVNPDVEVEVGDRRFKAHARPLANGPERDALYAKHASFMPGFAEYEKHTDRTIPVIVLEPERVSKAA
jgi:deazaflavin-dependent oxidoreductase (nitroreductase family)